MKVIPVVVAVAVVVDKVDNEQAGTHWWRWMYLK